MIYISPHKISYTRIVKTKLCYNINKSTNHSWPFMWGWRSELLAPLSSAGIYQSVPIISRHFSTDNVAKIMVDSSFCCIPLKCPASFSKLALTLIFNFSSVQFSSVPTVLRISCLAVVLPASIEFLATRKAFFSSFNSTVLGMDLQHQIGTSIWL